LEGFRDLLISQKYFQEFAWKLQEPETSYIESQRVGQVVNAE